MKTKDFKNSIEIYPFEDSHRHVTVYKPEQPIWEDERIEPARINWSALGSQSPEIAEQYAKGILKAVEIAKELNNE